MEKDDLFFNTDGKGLTSTSANYLANLAKEMIRENELFLEGMTFYSTSVKALSMETENLLDGGYSATDLATVADRLRRISEAKALIAWLREAVKAKESLLVGIEELSDAEYAELVGIAMPEAPEEEYPMTEREYWASLTPEERSRYYSLEALAATLGKAIHPGGSFADSRNELLEKGRKPFVLEGSGVEATLYKYTATVENWEVEDVYFRLQKQYRDAQSRLNEMKHACEKALTDSRIATAAKNNAAMRAYREECSALSEKCREYILRRGKEIASWRILIPENLTEIYELVSELGKKE